MKNFPSFTNQIHLRRFAGSSVDTERLKLQKQHTVARSLDPVPSISTAI